MEDIEKKLKGLEETNLKLMHENFEISNNLDLMEKLLKSLAADVIKLAQRVESLEKK